MHPALTRLKSIASRLQFWDWVVWFGLGGYFTYLFFSGGPSLLLILALLFLGTGVAHLYARAWTWHLGIVAYSAIAILSLYMTLTREPTLLRLCMTAGCIWGLVSHYRERERFENLETEDDESSEKGPRRSLVLWLREPIYIDASILGQVASRAYELPFNEGEDCESFVVGKGINHIMRAHDAWFLIIQVETSYFDDAQAAAESLRELRRAAAVRDHRAWLAVDFMRAFGELPEARIYDLIGRFLAELSRSGADVLAVFNPATGEIMPWDSAAADTLSSGDPLAAFSKFNNPPVIRVAGDSAAMAAAEAEARRRWPEFVDAYQRAADTDHFSVKAPVTEGGNTEFIWIKVKALAGDQIHGLLANDPVSLGDLKLGSFVTVSSADINDWVYPNPAAPDQPLGLFTVQAVHENEAS